MPQPNQPALQPQGTLPGSPEFGPHTPQIFAEISPDRRINFRRFVGIVASEVEPEYCTDEDREHAKPEEILGSLLLKAGDPRRVPESDPEQLIVVGRDMKVPGYSEEAPEETFYYPGRMAVVFDEVDFRKVSRAPGDLAKAMKAQNRAQNQERENAETEEQLELSIEDKGFTAIRAAIHTLDQYIVGMDELSSALSYRRQMWSTVHRSLGFPVYAHYNGRAVHKLWGRTDAEIHKLADLSTLNAPQELYGVSGMHRAIRNNLYSPEGDVHPADAFRYYIGKLIKPYSRAKYEKVLLAIKAAAEVRNRHMEMLPASMQGSIVADRPDAYESHIRPRMFHEAEQTEGGASSRPVSLRRRPKSSRELFWADMGESARRKPPAYWDN
ncbi:MAG TPA: hypothetical protein VFW77_02005 [Candidatus Saccharimonadales bacterium]|nr:hypothetical protein [Candidatus Saccharimonadales bacterium]